MEIIKSLLCDYWKNLTILVLLLFICCSCDIQKKAFKTKNDSVFKEEIETKTFRKGDTVTYHVPNIVFKDTIIYRKNIQGTILKTVYDKKGIVSSIDCFASTIEEIKKENREFKNSFKNKNSEKEKSTKSDFIFLGLIIFLIVIYFLKK